MSEPAFGTYMVQTSVACDDTRREILAFLATHGTVLQQFHELYYNAYFTWGMSRFAGIGAAKCPFDLWTYQEILTESRPRTIIETGTYKGGSALWFAFLLEVLGIDGHVYTMDITDQRDPRARHPRVTFLEGSSIDPHVVARLTPSIQYPLLVSLDSEHTAAHVEAELTAYAPLCQVNDWLVIEDTNISWASDAGARGGAEAYLRAHPGEWEQDILRERHLLSMHPGGWWQRRAPCPHRGGQTSHDSKRRRVAVPRLRKAQR